MTRTLLATTAAIGLVLGTASLAQAQDKPNESSGGTTSGPAAGTNATPDASVQKKAGNNPSAAMGSPGAAGGKGNENGPSPKR